MGHTGWRPWPAAAFDAVVQGGFDKARVLLADTLGVTDGNFYWRLSGHADLLAALLALWGRTQDGRAATELAALSD